MKIYQNYEILMMTSIKFKLTFFVFFSNFSNIFSSGKQNKRKLID